MYVASKIINYKIFSQTILNLEDRSDQQQTHTRNIENHLITPFSRTNYGEQTVKVRGTLLWNALPASLTELANTKSFRKKWKQSRPLYTDT